MNSYRECVRHLWNTYFKMPNPKLNEIEAAFRFDEIAELLFRELVLAKIGQLGFKRTSNREIWPFLKIVMLTDEGCPALISRPSTDGGIYWDEPINQIEGAGSDLRFIDYFDWEEFGYIDYRYYKVKILAFPKHPNLVGREALIETHHVRVCFEEAGPPTR